MILYRCSCILLDSDQFIMGCEEVRHYLKRQEVMTCPKMNIADSEFTASKYSPYKLQLLDRCIQKIEVFEFSFS